MRLEVRADNAAARKLYESTGYARIAVLPDYYEDGAAAWRYEKALGKAPVTACSAEPGPAGGARP